MKVTDLEPNAYWDTDLIDLHLGAAVQAAWQEGKQTAHEAHKAAQQAGERGQQLMRGRAQC